MSYFAELNESNEVINVIVANEEFIQKISKGRRGRYIKTQKDSATEEYAGIGYEFHHDIRKFVSKRQFNSWVLDEELGAYVAPIAQKKNELDYIWDEEKRKWEKPTQRNLGLSDGREKK
jgi:hypothetical protein